MAVACGVAASDCEDALQDVLIAAWRAVQEGRYRPDPRAERRRALRGLNPATTARRLQVARKALADRSARRPRRSGRRRGAGPRCPPSPARVTASLVPYAAERPDFRSSSLKRPR
ncbi:hypothetical protein SCE1572_35565 [Sorangium cellulosum So0157-2]|uniref:RNA polymerase sigma-70 region 2 domain-containing protein n=2 Tax=Sorangium cellulosum TaxID=56 RepID=S4Y527_SORCE|nr:hypothetical protein SCE1572_35565 [Sorangium cellulosum So0157-2]